MNHNSALSTSLIFVTFLLVFGIYTTYGSADEHNWPRWRGPNGDGISMETNWNPKALKKINIKWQKKIGMGFSSPAINDEYLFITGNDNGVDTVWCLNYQDGKEIWKYEYKCAPGQWPGPKNTPTIHEGFVYIISQESDVFCLESKTGKLKWYVNLVNDFGAKLTVYAGISGSPVIEDNLILINALTTGIALDKETGKKVWAGKSGTGGYATPVVFNSNGQKYAALFGEENLFIIIVKSGKVIASYPWVTRHDVNATDPIIIKNQVFISSAYDHGCILLELEKNELKPIWKNKNMTSHFSPVLYFGDKLYGIHNLGESTWGDIVCLDPKTGRQLWLVEGRGKAYSSVSIADNKFIIQSENGGLTIAKEKDNRLKELSSNSLPRGIYWTPPVLCRGILYARDWRNGVLYAVDMSN